MEKGPMYGNLKYKQFSQWAALWEELEVKLLLRNFLTTFLMALEENKFFLNVLVRLFMSRWKPAQVLLTLHVWSTCESAY